MNEMPARWRQFWQITPVNGRQCWLRWLDGSTDGPYDVFAMAFLCNSREMGLELEHVVNEKRKTYHYELNEPDSLSYGGVFRQEPEFMEPYVFLATEPGEYEQSAFSLTSEQPQVWWREPPPFVPKEDEPKE